MPTIRFKFSLKKKRKRKKNVRFAVKDEWDIREFIKWFENRLYFFFYILSNKIIKFFPTFSPIRVYLYN